MEISQTIDSDAHFQVAFSKRPSKARQEVELIPTASRSFDTSMSLWESLRNKTQPGAKVSASVWLIVLGHPQ
jgi:hypothetical protein